MLRSNNMKRAVDCQSAVVLEVRLLGDDRRLTVYGTSSAIGYFLRLKLTPNDANGCGGVCPCAPVPTLASSCTLWPTMYATPVSMITATRPFLSSGASMPTSMNGFSLFLGR